MSLKELLKKTEASRMPLFSPTSYSNRLSYEDLVNAESELGRTLFGPIPVGHRR